MAYVAKNLSVLAYSNGFTLWRYSTPDTAFDVEMNGYFNAAAYMIRAGDKIFTTTEADGEVKGGLFVVYSNVSEMESRTRGRSPVRIRMERENEH